MSKLLKLVQIAKRDLQLDDATYRDILETMTGQRSARGLNDVKLGKVIDHFKTLGFVPRPSESLTPKKTNRYRCAEASKILAIWITMHKQGFVRNGNDAALDAYVKRMTSQINGGAGVAKLAWVNSAAASYVLEAIKEWHYRVMCDAIRAAGLPIPMNDKCTGPAGYDKLAKFYISRFMKTNKE